MKSSKQLVIELKKLNSRLDQLSNSSRYMIYSANPFKFAWFNFIAGVFHSLGALFGTAVIAAALVYLFSQLNFQSIINSLVQNSLNQINIQKIVPHPQVN